MATSTQLRYSILALATLCLSTLALVYLIAEYLLADDDVSFSAWSAIVIAWWVLNIAVIRLYLNVVPKSHLDHLPLIVTGSIAIATSCGILIALTPIGSNAVTRLPILFWLFAPCLTGILLRLLLPQHSKAVASAIQVWIRQPEAASCWTRAFIACLAAVWISEIASSLLATREGLRHLALHTISLRPINILLNALILASVMAMFFAMSGRLGFALLLSLALFACLSTANMIKLFYLEAPVAPLDIHYLGAFGVYWSDYIGWTWTVALFLAAIVVLILLVSCWRQTRYRPSYRDRLIAILGASSLMSTFAWSEHLPPIKTVFSLTKTGLAQNSPKRSAQRNGLLMDLVLHIPYLHPSVPEGYSASEMHRVATHLKNATIVDHAPHPDKVDIIIYFVESLMDPHEMPFVFTDDPIPHMRALMRSHIGGHAIAPGFRGGSANAEFEVLTGMSMSFLPANSCPYIQYLKRDVPSLPRTLKQLGYNTFAIQTGPRGMYNYKSAYRHLGVDTFIAEGDLAHLGSLVRGRITDNIVVDQVISCLPTEPDDHPCFVLAFTNMTHGPYDYDQYQNSSLDVRDAEGTEQLREPLRRELKTYINAINDADRSVERLTTHLQKTRRKTILVVLGDHQPPLTFPLYVAAGWDKDWNVLDKKYRVPFAIWTNFGARERVAGISLNCLGAFILRLGGLPQEGIFSATEALRRECVFVGPFLKLRDNTYCSPEAAPVFIRNLWRDYRLLQYDVLFGNQHSLAGLDSP